MSEARGRLTLFYKRTKFLPCNISNNISNNNGSWCCIHNNNTICCTWQWKMSNNKKFILAIQYTCWRSYCWESSSPPVNSFMLMSYNFSCFRQLHSLLTTNSYFIEVWKLMIFIGASMYFLTSHIVELLLLLWKHPPLMEAWQIMMSLVRTQEISSNSACSNLDWSIVVTINIDKKFHFLFGSSRLFMTLVHCNLFNHANKDIPSNDSLLIPTISFFMNVSKSRMGYCSHRVYWSRCGYGVFFITLHIKSSSNTCDDYLHSTNTNTIDTIIATCSFATLKFHNSCCNSPHVKMGVKLLWWVEFDPFMCISEQLLVENGMDWYMVSLH